MIRSHNTEVKVQLIVKSFTEGLKTKKSILLFLGKKIAKILIANDKFHFVLYFYIFNSWICV